MKTRLLSLFVTCLLAGASTAIRAATYTIVDLGPGVAYAINSSGNIVGGDAYWDGSTYNKTTLNGYACAINDNGSIAGQASFEYWFESEERWVSASQAAYWSSYTANPASVHVYGDGTLDGSDDVESESSGGLGIDGSGNVVGNYYWGNGQNDSGIAQEGSLLDATTLTSPDYPDPSHGDPYWSWATGASANGYICGQFAAAVSVDEYEVEHIWDHGYLLDGANFTDLGTLEGSDKTAGEYSRATAVTSVSSNPYVVGYSSTASDEEHACVWTAGTYATISDLDTLSGGTGSRALAVSVVSSAVQVVGQSNGTGFSGTHAFIWDTTNGMRDLNSLIDPNSGWELKAAYGINSSGRIVGYGIKNNQTRAFLLY